MAARLWKDNGKLETNTKWDLPELSVMVKQIRSATGSAGPDGWRSGEIANIPIMAIEDLRTIQVRWGKAGNTGSTQRMQDDKPPEAEEGERRADEGG